ncbi:RNA-binding protein Musashi-like protein 1 [Larimichthys crocea]|uniref:Uncharacterized protein n=1 Tax=Larimichthys crocea TaxID=215358 RepID=A0ACD3Q942_LARCR|nr:RNA-binding protein Musashi-like protein 1 [Larimichthys crocea]
MRRPADSVKASLCSSRSAFRSVNSSICGFSESGRKSGQVSRNVTGNGLKEYFCKYGEVKECMVMRDPVTKRSRGFGFVTFVDQAGVDKVLAQTRHELDSKTMEPDEGRCTFIQQRLERRCTLTRRKVQLLLSLCRMNVHLKVQLLLSLCRMKVHLKVQHLLSLCRMKVHLKVQLLLSLCRMKVHLKVQHLLSLSQMKVHLKVQLQLSICRMKLKNSSVTEEKDNKAHHLQSFLGIPEIINKCPLSCEFRGLSGGPAVSGLSEHPQGLDGYPGFQTATYTSRSYAGITPGYTYQFPEFHLERTPLLTSPHPPELTAIPLTAYGPMAAAAAAAAVVRGSTPSRSAGFLGTSSPGPMADLYGTASQESAVNSYLSAASPAPSTGFSHSLGGPLIATAFTNGYH